MTNLDELKKLAEAATPGPWHYDCGNWEVESQNKDTFRYSICNLIEGMEETEPVDALPNGEYIAAANPQTVLALIERIRTYEAKLNSHEEALKESREVFSMCDKTYPRNAPENPEVKELCEKWGYGAVMSSASWQWREMLRLEGAPIGAGFVSGPCYGTIKRTIEMIDKALEEGRKL